MQKQIKRFVDSLNTHSQHGNLAALGNAITECRGFVKPCSENADGSEFSVYISEVAVTSRWYFKRLRGGVILNSLKPFRAYDPATIPYTPRLEKGVLVDDPAAKVSEYFTERGLQA